MTIETKQEEEEESGARKAGVSGVLKSGRGSKDSKGMFNKDGSKSPLIFVISSRQKICISKLKAVSIHESREVGL